MSLWTWWFHRKLTAVELKSGGIYVIQATQPMDAGGLRDIVGHLGQFSDKTGCQFLLLDHSFKLTLSNTKGH